MRDVLQVYSCKKIHKKGRYMVELSTYVYIFPQRGPEPHIDMCFLHTGTLVSSCLPFVCCRCDIMCPMKPVIEWVWYCIMVAFVTSFYYICQVTTKPFSKHCSDIEPPPTSVRVYHASRTCLAEES